MPGGEDDFQRVDTGHQVGGEQNPDIESTGERRSGFPSLDAAVFGEVPAAGESNGDFGRTVAEYAKFDNALNVAAQIDEDRLGEVEIAPPGVLVGNPVGMAVLDGGELHPGQDGGAHVQGCRGRGGKRREW